MQTRSLIDQAKDMVPEIKRAAPEIKHMHALEVAARKLDFSSYAALRAASKAAGEVEAERVDLRAIRPGTVEQIKALANMLKKRERVAHRPALNQAAQQAGFRDFHAAQAALDGVVT